jgi:hypothetical protein
MSEQENDVQSTLLYCVLDACRIVFVSAPSADTPAALSALVASHLLALEHTILIADASTKCLMSSSLPRAAAGHRRISEIHGRFGNLFSWASRRSLETNDGVAFLFPSPTKAMWDLSIPRVGSSTDDDTTAPPSMACTPLELATKQHVAGLRRNPNCEIICLLDSAISGVDSSELVTRRLPSLMSQLTVEDISDLLQSLLRIQQCTNPKVENGSKAERRQQVEGDALLTAVWDRLICDTILRRWGHDLKRRQAATFSGRTAAQREAQRYRFLMQMQSTLSQVVELCARSCPSVLEAHRDPLKRLMSAVAASAAEHNKGLEFDSSTISKDSAVPQRKSVATPLLTSTLLLEGNWRHALHAVDYLPTRRDQRKAALHVLKLTVSLGGHDAVTALVTASLPQLSPHAIRNGVGVGICATPPLESGDEKLPLNVGDATSSLPSLSAPVVGVSTIGLPQLISYAAEYCRAQNTPESMERLGSVVESITKASMLSPRLWAVGILCCNLAYGAPGNQHMIRYASKSLQQYLAALTQQDREQVLLTRVFAAVSYAGKRYGQWESVISAYYSQLNRPTSSQNDIVDTTTPHLMQWSLAKQLLAQCLAKPAARVSSDLGALHILMTVLYAAQQVGVAAEVNSNSRRDDGPQCPQVRRMAEWALKTLPTEVLSTTSHTTMPEDGDGALHPIASAAIATASPSSSALVAPQNDAAFPGRYQKNLSETMSLLLSSRKRPAELTQGHGVAILSAVTADASRSGHDDMHRGYDHPSVGSLTAHRRTHHHDGLAGRRHQPATQLAPREVAALSFLAECRIHGQWEIAIGALMKRLESKHDHHSRSNHSSDTQVPHSDRRTLTPSLAWSMVHVPLTICNDMSKWNTAIAAYFAVKRRVKNVNLLQQATFEGLVACRATGRWRDAVRMVTVSDTRRMTTLAAPRTEDVHPRPVRVTPRNASLLLNTLATFGAIAVSAVVARHVQHIREPHVVDEVMAALVANRQWNDAVDYFYETVQHGVRVRDRSIALALNACDEVSRHVDSGLLSTAADGVTTSVTAQASLSSSTERQRASVVASIAGALEDLCLVTGAVLQHVLFVVHKKKRSTSEESFESQREEGSHQPQRLSVHSSGESEVRQPAPVAVDYLGRL